MSIIIIIFLAFLSPGTMLDNTTNQNTVIKPAYHSTPNTILYTAACQYNWLLLFLFFFFLFFCIFRAAAAACGSSQARSWIGTTATGHHSHSNARSSNPLSEARDRTHVLMDTSQVRYCWVKTGTPGFIVLKFFCLFFSYDSYMHCFLKPHVTLTSFCPFIRTSLHSDSSSLDLIIRN